MKPAPIRPNQIRAIHAIKTRVRLDEASYRALLSGYGVATSKAMSAADAERLLARLRDIPGASRPVEAASATGRYAPKLQALWIAAWNLGVVRNRTDAAMHRFVERQTGITHSRFLRDPADAARAIEALKGWLERTAGIDWPQRTGDPGRDLLAVKRAVLRAQWRRGLALGLLREIPGGIGEDFGLVQYLSQVTRGVPRGIGALDCPSVTAKDLDAGASALGRKLRKALADAR